MSAIRVLLLAPANEILGGQTVQAFRLLKLLGDTPGIEMRFQPNNPRFPTPLGWVKRIPVARTILSMFLYVPIVFWKSAQADIVHIFTAGLSSYTLWTIPATMIGKLLRRKVIINYRDGQGEQHLRTYRSAKPTLLWADAIISPSAFITDVFARYGIPAGTIYNVIDPDRFRYRKRTPLRPLLLSNRGLEPLYNIECILRAFERVLDRYPDAFLTIAHEGPSASYLKDYATRLGLRNYRFVGKVAQEDMPALYDEHDIYLMTPNIDCMPGTLLECMASGIPIVTTRTGGIPFVVTDEKNALLVDSDDDKGVAERVHRLLEDPALVERLTADAFREVANYRGEPIRDQWVALYQKLLNRGHD